MSTLDKQLKVLSPILTDPDNLSDLYNRMSKKTSGYDGKTINTLIDIGRMKNQPTLFALERKIDLPRFYKKLKKLIQKESGKIELSLEEKENEWFLKIGPDKLSVSKTKPINVFKGNSIMEKELSNTFCDFIGKIEQQIGSGKFYFVYSDTPYVGDFQYPGVMVFIKNDQKKVLKNLSSVSWNEINQMSSPLGGGYNHGSLHISKEPNLLEHTWRTKFSILTYFVLIIFCTVVYFYLSDVFDWERKVSSTLKLILLCFGTFLGIFDFFNRKKSVTITQEKVSSRSGVIPIPLLTYRSVPLANIARAWTKSRIVDSGNTEGPSFSSTYYDVYVTTKTLKEFRLAKGLHTKSEATFIERSINKSKDKYRQKNR